MGYNRDDVMFYSALVAVVTTLCSGMLSDTSLKGTAFALGVIAIGSVFVGMLAYLNHPLEDR